MAQQVIQSWTVRPPPGFHSGGRAVITGRLPMSGRVPLSGATEMGATEMGRVRAGAASDTGVTMTPGLQAAAAALQARLAQSVPPELTFDATTQAFQQAYVDAGNTLPATHHAANGVDGLYGPDTATALAATLGSNVPAPSVTPGGGGGPSPAPPSQNASVLGGGLSWWQWVLLLLAGGAAVGLGARQLQKHEHDQAFRSRAYMPAARRPRR